MEPYLVVLLTLAAVAVVEFILILAASGGSFARFALARAAFRRIARSRRR